MLIVFALFSLILGIIILFTSILLVIALRKVSVTLKKINTNIFSSSVSLRAPQHLFLQ